MVTRRSYLKAAMQIPAAIINLRPDNALAQSMAKTSSILAIDASIPSVSPYDFGAIGDGKTNDTKACNAAAAQAQKNQGQLIFPPGKYLIDDYIVIRNGVRQVVGNGGIIVFAHHAQNAGILLAGKATGNKFNVRNCIVYGLKIDCGNSVTHNFHAIYGQNISECSIFNNHIFNLVRGVGILLRAFEAGSEAAHGNLIASNIIQRNSGIEPMGAGIQVDASFTLHGKPLVMSDYWRNQHAIPNAPFPPQNTFISKNKVVGGYYGIAMSSAQNCLVEFNELVGNTRSISIQNRCTGNSVSGNRCLDSLSSGIHLAYGSSNNVIRDNLIDSNRARGEGLLQAYVGSMNNRFEDNVIKIGTKGLPKYHCYTAVQSDGNLFIRNDLSGPCARAYLAVESAFNAKSHDPLHYAFKVSTSTNGMTAEGMKGITFTGNTIDVVSAVPVFYLAQIQDEDASYPLTNCEIQGNYIKGATPSHYLRLVENTFGELSKIRFENNSFPPEASAAGFVAPRGRLHFLSNSHNVITFIAS